MNYEGFNAKHKAKFSIVNGKDREEEPTHEAFKAMPSNHLVLAHLATLEGWFACTINVGFLSCIINRFITKIISRIFWGYPHFPLDAPLLIV